MTTDRATTLIANVQPTTLRYGQSLSPRECGEHRAWIGVRVEALMEGYWQSRPSDLVKAELMADWMAALVDFTPDEIRTACREYLNSPDRARKPKPGDIRSTIFAARGAELARQRAAQPRHHEPERDITPEDLERRREFAQGILRSFAARATNG